MIDMTIMMRFYAYTVRYVITLTRPKGYTFWKGLTASGKKFEEYETWISLNEFMIIFTNVCSMWVLI